MTILRIIPTINNHKKISTEWFTDLRDQICKKFEDLEDGAKFKRTEWSREDGGGGEISVMKGNIFEKVGVNISTVFGTLSEKFRHEIPGAKEDPRFWASGISLVSHMKSPHVPTIHMNTRHIYTTQSWFGGGMDLTPMFNENPHHTKIFHEALKNMCDMHDINYYNKFKDWADKYFFIEHRGESRGVGGIFYDYLNTNNWKKDFEFTVDVGKCFIEIYPKIIEESMHKPWSNEDKEMQLYKRGRYAEFNLIQDRGTRFGLMTGGNIDAILMSLPPEVKWP